MHYTAPWLMTLAVITEPKTETDTTLSLVHFLCQASGVKRKRPFAVEYSDVTLGKEDEADHFEDCAGVQQQEVAVAKDPLAIVVEEGEAAAGPGEEVEDVVLTEDDDFVFTGEDCYDLGQGGVVMDDAGQVEKMNQEEEQVSKLLHCL